jgi:hypothetical protein
MEVLVGGSAVLDIATKADLDQRTDRITRLLERPHARYDVKVFGRAPRAGNNPFAMKSNDPAPRNGMLWLVQWAWLSGDDPTASTAIANVRAVLVKGAAPPDAQLSLAGTQWGGLDFAGIILPGMVIPTPNAVTIPDKSVVYDHEEVYFVLAGSGLVAGANQYHGAIGVIELPQTPEALTW